MFRHKDENKAADWILFPEYWQINSLVYSLQRRLFPGLSSYHLGHDVVADRFYILKFNTLFGTVGLQRRNIPVGGHIVKYLRKNFLHPTTPPNFRPSA